MTVRVSRRTAIAIGACGAGSIALGVAGLAAGGGVPEKTRRGDDAAGGAPWSEPAVLESSGGLLACELRVAAAPVEVAGGAARMLTYNGTVPGPTLHVRPGDTLRVRLVNELDEPTNLHTHGLEVSPAGASDNPMIEIAPGQAFDYELSIPADHPSGVFWYHPHRHGLVAAQVFGGLYGAIVVDSDDWSAGAPRIAVVSDTTIVRGEVAQPNAAASADGRVGDTLLTNGLVAPVLTGGPGGVERVLVINACATRYLDLDLGGRTVRVRGRDGGAFEPAVETRRVLVVPGGRVDLEMEVPAEPVDLVARAYALHGGGMGGMGGMGGTGGMGGMGATPADATVLTLGPGGAPRPVAPRTSRPRRDLRDAPVVRRRIIRMTGGMSSMAAMTFDFDGRPFDADRVDQDVSLGTVEEWVLENASPMHHPFHLHTWPMQVMDATPGVVDVRDVVDVPAGATVTVRIAFDRFAGVTVYHCHILDHEDLGMMGVVEAS